MKPVCTLQLRSIDEPNEDSWRRLDSNDWDHDGRRWRSVSDVLTGVWLVSFYGIYSLVFIVETDMMTQWPDTREDGAAMFGASAWLNSDLRGTEQLRAVSHDRERRTPTDLGLDPGVASAVTAVKKPCLMMDDEGYRRRGGMY